MARDKVAQWMKTPYKFIRGNKMILTLIAGLLIIFIAIIMILAVIIAALIAILALLPVAIAETIIWGTIIPIIYSISWIISKPFTSLNKKVINYGRKAK